MATVDTLGCNLWGVSGHINLRSLCILRFFFRSFNQIFVIDDDGGDDDEDPIPLQNTTARLISNLCSTQLNSTQLNVYSPYKWQISDRKTTKN